MASTKRSIEQVKAKHELELMGIDGVEGVGIGEEKNELFLKVYVAKLTRKVKEQVPEQVEGYPVRIEVSGEFRARSH